MSLDTRPDDVAPENLPIDRVDRVWVRRLLIPLTILAWGFVIFFTLLLAGHVVETLIFIAVAVLIAYALGPAVNWLDRWMPRWLAILIAYIIFGAALAAFVFLIVNTLTRELPQFSQFVQRVLASDQVQSLLKRVGISPSSLGTLGGGGGSLFGGIASIAGNIVPVVTGVASGAIGIVVILVLSIYFIAAGPHIGRWLRTRMPINQRTRVLFFLETTNRVVGGYIRGQVTLAALVGLLVGLGMFFLFRLPFAALLGLLAFVLEFIPYLGVIVSGAACVLVALTQGFFTALLVLGYFAVIHVIEGEVVGPRIVGRFVGLHPAVSLIALIAGAELFGIWGAVFAAPVAGLIQALVETFWTEYRRAHPELFPPDTPALAAEDGHTGDGHKRPPGEDSGESPDESPGERERKQAEQSNRFADRFGGVFFRRSRT